MGAGDMPGPVQSLLDVRQTRELLGYAAASLRRHRVQILVLTLATTALSVPAMFLVPRTYTTTARVAARRDVTMVALAHPQRSLPFYTDNPAHQAPELVLRDDQLRELIRRIDLASTFRERRPPLLQLKDVLVNAILGPPTEEEFRKSLVGAIERSVHASTANDIVTITGTWRDPQTASEIVDTLKQMFMEERRRMEVEPIREAVKLIAEEAQRATLAVDVAVAELRTLHEADRVESQRRARKLRGEIEAQRMALLRQEQAAREAQRAEFEQLADLQSQLVAKRRAISEAESTRGAQARELRAQLASAEARLGEKHPERQALQRNLRALEAGMPNIEVLKREEEELAREFTSRGGKRTADHALASATARLVLPMPDPAAAGTLLGRPSDDEDEAVVHKRTQVRLLVDQAQDLQDRLLGARIELRVAEDALRFRYYVLQDAEPPRRPDRLQHWVILLGGVASGALLGILLALARDIVSGRIFQAWQVDRFLGLRLVGEVDLPAPR